MDRIRGAQITSQALKTRKAYLGLDAHSPICPYTLSEAMGLDLRFVKIASFEGMYVSNQNLILISSDRPEGRKRFTCAHEIAHHVLGHGTVIDEVLENGSNKKEEQEADFFASMLLMPSSAIKKALISYRIKPENITSIDAYILSKYFGVSYQAFIFHIYGNLKIIDFTDYKALKSVKLNDIRSQMVGFSTSNQIFSIGEWWIDKAVEMEVGDFIISDVIFEIDGPQTLILEEERFNKYVYKAVAPGISAIRNKGWSSFVKVSRFKFQGFYQYKYDEDEE